MMATIEHVRETSDRSFADDVLHAAKPVLVDFSAGWCGPCQALAPILDAVAAEKADRLEVVKLDVDANPEITNRYAVRSVPTLLLFQGGQPVARQAGLLPKARLAAWIEGAL
jgi:thioredoxin 1